MANLLQGRVLDLRGRGWPGVPVSNGEAIVHTRANGSFHLPLDSQRHTHVFLITPADAESVGPTHYALDRCSAEPPVFQLRKRQRLTGTLRFAAVTDMHYGEVPPPGPAADRQLRSDLAAVIRNADRPRFVLTVGDLTQTGTPEELATVCRILDRQPLPVVRVFGNHDGLLESKTLKADPPRCRNYLAAIGPAWYSFDLGPWHFTTIVNDTHFLSPPMYEAQARWLAADLRLAKQRGLHTIAVMHFPPTMSHAQWLARRGVRLLLCGHFHCLRSYQLGAMRVLTFPPVTGGGIDMTPRGFLDVAAHPDGSVDYRYKLLAPAFMKWPRPARKLLRRLVWHRALPGYCHRASPAHDGAGRLFVTSSADDRSDVDVGYLHCLDADTGRVRWQRAFNEAVRASPAIDGANVLVLTHLGTLECLRRDDGNRVWARKLRQHPDRWLLDAPVVIGGVVIAGHTSGGIEAFDAATGAPRWQFNADRPPFRNSAGDVWPTDRGFAAAGDVFLAGQRGKGVFRFDPTDGQVAWQFACPWAYFAPAPLIWRDRVWIPAPQAAEPLVQIGVGDGVERWRVPSQGASIAWAADDRCIYVVALDHWHTGQACLQCRDGDTGTLQWQRPLGHDPTHAYTYARGNGPNVHCPPVIAQGHVYLTRTDGVLLILDANDGRTVSAVPVGGPGFASPLVADGKCWLALWNGEVVCINVS